MSSKCKMLHKLLVLTAILGLALASRKELTKEQIDRLLAWRKGQQNMWQLSGQVEGDMVLRPGQRNGLIDSSYRWDNNEIPYELDGAFDEKEAAAIHEAVKEFANVSCVTVRPRTPSDNDYVYVTGENTGCWSWVGRLGGRQELNLQRQGCVWHHIIVHEFLHAVGFYHQQSSTDRDDYVSIIWENIMAGMEHNFDKYNDDYITSFGQSYDLGSIMHYEEYAFSSNGKPTIVPIDDAWIGSLGKAQVMSDVDIAKIELMYNC